MDRNLKPKKTIDGAGVPPKDRRREQRKKKPRSSLDREHYGEWVLNGFQLEEEECREAGPPLSGTPSNRRTNPLRLKGGGPPAGAKRDGAVEGTNVDPEEEVLLDRAADEPIDDYVRRLVSGPARTRRGSAPTEQVKRRRDSNIGLIDLTAGSDSPVKQEEKRPRTTAEKKDGESLLVEKMGSLLGQLRKDLIRLNAGRQEEGEGPAKMARVRAMDLMKVESTVSQMLTSKMLGALETCMRRTPAGAGPGVPTKEAECQATIEDIQATQEARDRSRRGAEIRRRLAEATTVREMEELMEEEWPEETYERSEVVEGNPLMGEEAESLALVLTEGDYQNPTGLFATAKSRYPEVFEPAGRDSPTILALATAITKNGRTVRKQQNVLGLCLQGKEVTDLQHAMYELKTYMEQVAATTVALPKITGVDLDTTRKVLEIVLGGTTGMVRIHVPVKPNRAGAKKTSAMVVEHGDYAEALKTVKATVKASGQSVEIRQMRKTKEGKLLIITPGGQESERLKNIIAAGTQGRLAVKRVGGGGPTTTVMLRNLEDDVTMEEVKEAINTMAGGRPIDIPVVDIFSTKFGKQARVKVTEKVAEDILATGRLKVGITTCTVQRWLEVPKCFRCWGVGHHQRDCEGPDRSELCRRCAKPGHKMAECEEERHCPICEVKGHSAGSAACKVGQTKVREELRKQKGEAGAQAKTPGAQAKTPRQRRRKTRVTPAKSTPGLEDSAREEMEVADAAGPPTRDGSATPEGLQC